MSPTMMDGIPNVVAKITQDTKSAIPIFHYVHPPTSVPTQEGLATGQGREVLATRLNSSGSQCCCQQSHDHLPIALVVHLAALVVHLAALVLNLAALVLHLAALVLPSCLSLGQYSMALLYILTAGGKSDLLHSLHRCRNLQCRSQEASWKLLDMHQPRRPETGDGTSRCPAHPLPTQPDTAVYPDRWKQASTSDHYFRLLTQTSDPS